MPHGGKRPGAGRPKGSRNKRTEKMIAAVNESGMTPLDYMLSVLRDESRDHAERIDAAKAAAPYVHSRLQSVEATGGGDLIIERRVIIEHVGVDQPDD